MSKMEYRLTTFDNPFDPFTQFDNWFLYDVERGYNSCAYLDRVLNESPNINTDSETATSDAIDEIIKNDFMNIYKKVGRPTD